LAQHPWWYYAPRLLVDGLPWSLALIPAAIWFVRRGIWRIDPQARLGICWLIAVVAILSFAKFKRADYLLPAYPGLALFLGCVGERLYMSARPLARRGFALGIGAIALGSVATWGYLVHFEHPRLEPRREQRTFARAVRAAAPA